MNMPKEHGLARALRVLVAPAIVAGMMAVSSSIASAQVTFAGNTSFQFDGVGPYANTQTLGGLTISNTGFITTTEAVTGFGSVGGTTSNFGTVSLDNSTFLYAGNTLSLLLSFTIPTVLDQTFYAKLQGSVIGIQGGVAITFNPSAIHNVPFSNGTTSGTFDIGINDVNVTPGANSQQISGYILANTSTTTGNQVAPEPASLVLLGTGLIGVVGLARRRRKA